MRNKILIPKLAIISPCYNEQEIIVSAAKALGDTVNDLILKGKIREDSFIYFVDDGSCDKTWDHIKDLNQKDATLFKGLKFSRNFGHQNAILGGMLSLKAQVDCVITIDVDLQDDVTLIEKFIDHYSRGYEIVYGVRNERQTDSYFKKNTALLFYRIMELLGVDIIYNHADYRLIGKKALQALDQFREVNLFLRGIFPQMGFQSMRVEYDRQKRLAGQTKYSFLKMLSLAIDGITSFSIQPLRFITFIGILVFIGTCFLSFWVLLTVFWGYTVPGWASTVLPLYFLGGIQTIFLGILGEYIGKIYNETKMRPRFIVEEILT